MWDNVVSPFCLPVRLRSQREQAGNLLWMAVNVLSVDVPSCPSPVTICGLGQSPERPGRLQPVTFMDRKSDQIWAFGWPHGTSDQCAVPVRGGDIWIIRSNMLRNKLSRHLYCRGDFLYMKCSEEWRDFTGVDKQLQQLRAWQEVFVITTLRRQKLIVYPDKRLCLHCRHNTVFDPCLPLLYFTRGVWGVILSYL